MSHQIDKRHYADIYGPTTGDRVRLGDTGLIAEVEQDATVYGDECKFGGGKVLRDQMGQMAGADDAHALDVIPTVPSLLDYTTREPVGVVAVLQTWNAPLNSLGLTVAPPLAASQSKTCFTATSVGTSGALGSVLIGAPW